MPKLSIHLNGLHINWLIEVLSIKVKEYYLGRVGLAEIHGFAYHSDGTSSNPKLGVEGKFDDQLLWQSRLQSTHMKIRFIDSVHCVVIRLILDNQVQKNVEASFLTAGQIFIVEFSTGALLEEERILSHRVTGPCKDQIFETTLHGHSDPAD